MTDFQWKVFCNFKSDFLEYITSIKNSVPNLREIQEAAAYKSGTPKYNFENPLVYNRALDEIKKEDEIKLIVIGDNPGKKEQLNENCRYLVGQAGKIAEGWFKKNENLDIDFRKNVIILNKTPVHSAKTSQLKLMEQLGGEKVQNLIEESQIWMAERTAKLHYELFMNSGTKSNTNEKNHYPQLWLVGYAELKNKGVFQKYKETLFNAYKKKDCKELWNSVLVFQHFSMNRFSIDLNDFALKSSITNETSSTLQQLLFALGTMHRTEIFAC